MRAEPFICEIREERSVGFDSTLVRSLMQWMSPHLYPRVSVYSFGHVPMQKVGKRQGGSSFLSSPFSRVAFSYLGHRTKSMSETWHLDA